MAQKISANCTCGADATLRFKITLWIVWAMFSVFSLIAGGVFWQLGKMADCLTELQTTIATISANQAGVMKRQEIVVEKQAKLMADQAVLANNVDNLSKKVDKK